MNDQHLSASHARLREVAASPSSKVDVDDTDRALLQLLAADARLSQRQLAKRLGVTPPTIGERIARLERLGVIRGYTVQVDWEALGYDVLVYLFVTTAVGYDVASVLQDLWAVPEVEDVVVVTGRLDILARLRARDHAHLREILMDHIWQVPGLQGTETLFSVASMPPKAHIADLIQHSSDQPQTGRS